MTTENSVKTVTVQFDVDVPDDATDMQIEEWVAFEVGARCQFNGAGNPLAHTDLQANRDSVRIH